MLGLTNELTHRLETLPVRRKSGGFPGSHDTYLPPDLILSSLNAQEKSPNLSKIAFISAIPPKCLDRTNRAIDRRAADLHCAERRIGRSET